MREGEIFSESFCCVGEQVATIAINVRLENEKLTTDALKRQLQ
jgi:hypothetical protein